MEKFNNNENYEGAGTALVEKDEDVEFLKIEELKNLSFEEFLYRIEDKLAEIERLDGESDEDLLKKIIEEKNKLLEYVDDIDRKKAIEILFGIEEVTVKGLIEKRKGKRDEEFRISGARWQQQIISYINENKGDYKKIKNFWDEYDNIFNNGPNYGDDDIEVKGKNYKSAVLSSLALQNILSDKYKMEINYPNPEEDVKYLIDMIALDKERKTAILIQIKGKRANARDEKWKDNKSENSENEAINVIKKDQFASYGEFKDEILNSFSRGCFDYLNNKGKDIIPYGYKIMGLFIDVPHTINNRRVVELNGAPTDKLWGALVGKKLEDKLNLPKVLNYDTFLKR